MSCCEKCHCTSLSHVEWAHAGTCHNSSCPCHIPSEPQSPSAWQPEPLETESPPEGEQSAPKEAKRRPSKTKHSNLENKYSIPQEEWVEKLKEQFWNDDIDSEWGGEGYVDKGGMELVPFISSLLSREREKERNKMSYEIIEAFGNMVVLNGEDARDPGLLAKCIKEQFIPHEREILLTELEEAVENRIVPVDSLENVDVDTRAGQLAHNAACATFLSIIRAKK